MNTLTFNNTDTPSKKLKANDVCDIHPGVLFVLTHYKTVADEINFNVS